MTKMTLEKLAEMTQNGLLEVKQEVSSVKQEVSSMKQEVSSVKQEVSSVRQEMRDGFVHMNARIDIMHKNMQRIATREEVHNLETRITIVEEKMHIAY